MRKRKGKVVVPSHGGIFPKDAESRLEALLLALNLEPKQSLTFCLDNRWKSARELWYEWKKLGVDWQPETAALAGYCEKSLIPNGLVRTHSIRYQNTSRPVKRYRLSNAGLYYGQPAAKLMLHYSVKNQHSLYEILGNAPSSGRSRGPPNRVNLMRRFASRITSPKKLMKELNFFYPSLDNHRSSLRSLGFIEYQPRIGGATPDIQVTDIGKAFLDELITPLYSLCRDIQAEPIEAALSVFQDHETARQYIVDGIKFYRTALQRGTNRVAYQDRSEIRNP